MYLSKKPEIQCPVCDSTIPEGAEKCPECELEREIIEMGSGYDEPSDELDEQLDELTDVDDDLDEEKKESKELERNTDDDVSLDESLEELEEELEVGDDEESLDDSIAKLEEELELEEETKKEEDTEEKIVYECPVCGKDVPKDADECPHCEVLFEEEEKTGEKPRNEFQKRFDRSLKKATSKFSLVKDEPVPKEYFEKLIEEAKELAEESRYEEGIDKLEEALEFGDELETLSGKLEKLNKKIQARGKKSIDHEAFNKDIKKVKEAIREGEVEKASSMIDEAMRKIERRKKEERADIKKRINKTVQDLNKMLEVAKKSDVSLGDIREIISRSLELSRKGKVDKALKVLEEARDKSSEVLRKNIDDNISALEEKKVSIFDDEKKKKIDRCLENAEEAADQEKFEEAYDYISRCQNMAEKSELKIGDMSVSEVIKIKELSEDIGLDCSEEEKLIVEAKKEHKKGDLGRSKKTLKKAKKSLLKRVPREVQRIMKEGMRELEDAKKRNKDISRPVTYLKQSNLMIKKRKFADALEYVNKFTESLDRISEKTDEVSTTVGKVEKRTEEQRYEKRTTGPSKTKEEKSYSRSKQRKSTRTESESSISDSTVTDSSVEFDIDEFYEGSTNLLKVKDLSESYDLFKELLKDNGRGVCVTREYPDKVKKKYELQQFLESEDTGKTSKNEIDLSIVWLSNVGSKKAVKPKDLEKLSFKLESFITSGGGPILLNGFEFLVSNNNFTTVLHLIQSLKDQVAMGGSILLITVSPGSFDTSQLDQLEREVDEVFQ